MGGRGSKWGLFMTTILAGALSTAIGHAQPPQPRPGAPGPVTGAEPSAMSTAEILGKLRSADQLEIRAAAMAQAKAEARPVRDFADKLVRDHAALDQKIATFAGKNNVSMDAVPMQPDTSALDALRSAQGAEFDRQFLAFAAQEHEKDIANVRQMRDQTSDPKLKALLDGALPTLEQHRASALKLQQQMGGGSATPQPRPESRGTQPTIPSRPDEQQGGGY